jgi:ABC-type uncharacterized transport system fused permease/ATPase subunit
MTQYEQVIDLFRRNNNLVTLGQIMQTTLAAEYRARFSEMRRQGYTIAFYKGRKASENTYVLLEPDKNGQLRLA